MKFYIGRLWPDVKRTVEESETARKSHQEVEAIFLGQKPATKEIREVFFDVRCGTRCEMWFWFLLPTDIPIEFEGSTGEDLGLQLVQIRDEAI